MQKLDQEITSPLLRPQQRPNLVEGGIVQRPPLGPPILPPPFLHGHFLISSGEAPALFNATSPSQRCWV
jgi:hypothetical protein